MFKIVKNRIKYKYNTASFKYYCFISDLVINHMFDMRIANKALSYVNARLFSINEKLWEIGMEYNKLTREA